MGKTSIYCSLIYHKTSLFPIFLNGLIDRSLIKYPYLLLIALINHYPWLGRNNEIWLGLINQNLELTCTTINRAISHLESRKIVVNTAIAEEFEQGFP